MRSPVRVHAAVSVCVWVCLFNLKATTGLIPMESSPRNGSSGSLSRSLQDDVCDQDTYHYFCDRDDPPYLAVITNRHSCDNDENLKESLESLKSAVSTGLVDLVSVRINNNVVPSDDDYDPRSSTSHKKDVVEERVLQLAKTLVKWSKTHNFSVVLSSDWRNLLLASGADGVHVKESDRACIAAIRQQKPECLIGTSCHSVESAMEAWHEYNVDYVFVGTCYVSDSHPEKSEDLLEGPRLPGEIQRNLHHQNHHHHHHQEQSFTQPSVPKVLAIGGIDSTNCHIPVGFGADGVAAIKSILQAEDSHQATIDIVTSIRSIDRFS